MFTRLVSLDNLAIFVCGIVVIVFVSVNQRWVKGIFLQGALDCSFRCLFNIKVRGIYYVCKFFLHNYIILSKINLFISNNCIFKIIIYINKCTNIYIVCM